MIPEILLIFFLLALILFLCYYYLSFFTGAPFVATPMSIVNEMMTVARVKKKEVVIDLGSGDGRILIAAAKKGALAKGWEINPFLVLWTNITARIQRVHTHVIVYCQTYHQANLQDADVVIFYNMPNRLPALEQKLKKELKRSARIVSFQFPLSTFKLKKQTKSGIFLYENF